MVYVIQARVSVHLANGYTSNAGVATFFLDSDIQGIVSAEHAEEIARGMLSHGQENIEVFAFASPAEYLVSRQ